MTAGINLALALVLGFAAAAAVPTPPSTPTGMTESLKAGQYYWAPEVAPVGPVTVIVRLGTQRAYAYRNGVPIAVSTVSMGNPRQAMPTGIFTILPKDIRHESARYDDAPMPFSERLTWYGIALHGGHLADFPASHGYIRLPANFARLLFGVARLGLTVIITDGVEVPRAVSLPIDLAGPSPLLPVASIYSWEPQKSPSGPLSIVISGRERRIVVMRNGIQIGSSPLIIDGPIASTMAFMLRAVDIEGYHWLRLPLPGQIAEGGKDMSPSERARVHLPAGFRTALNGVLEPGAILLVTRDSLRASGLGTRLKVISTEKN